MELRKPFWCTVSGCCFVAFNISFIFSSSIVSSFPQRRRSVAISAQHRVDSANVRVQKPLPHLTNNNNNNNNNVNICIARLKQNSSGALKCPDT